MEGTKADVVGALLPELYAIGLNDPFKIMPSFNRLDVCFANPHKNLSRGKCCKISKFRLISYMDTKLSYMIPNVKNKLE